VSKEPGAVHTAGADRTGQSLDQRIIFSRELK